jgi:hypothetical protein
VDRLVEQVVRDGVVVAVDLDVTIDVDAATFHSPYTKGCTGKACRYG